MSRFEGNFFKNYLYCFPADKTVFKCHGFSEHEIPAVNDKYLEEGGLRETLFALCNNLQWYKKMNFIYLLSMYDDGDYSKQPDHSIYYIIDEQAANCIRKTYTTGEASLYKKNLNSYETLCKEVYLEYNYEKGPYSEIVNLLMQNDRHVLIVKSMVQLLEFFSMQYKRFQIRESEFANSRPMAILNHKQEIRKEMEAQGFLQAVAYSNADKLKEYQRLHDFCLHCKDLDGPLSDFEKYIDPYVEKNSNLFDISEYQRFKENWFRLNRSLNVLRRGAEGEKKVAEVLSLFDDRIRYFQNYSWGFEHDFLILSPAGIFTVEVKTMRGSHVLTETGILKPDLTHSRKSSHTQGKDVALQSKRHLETLRKNLKGCRAFSDSIPLREIICSAEPTFTIRDDYHLIPICYYNTLDKIILPNDSPKVLSPEAIDEIYAYLLEHKEEPHRFDILLPRGEFDSKEAFFTQYINFAAVCKRLDEEDDERIKFSQI